MTRRRAADIVLRAGVAFAFLYPPASALYDPYSWIGYFPHFMKGYVPDMVLLHGFGLFEVLIALWILSGWRIAWPSALALVMLLMIVAFNPSTFELLFRDLSIAAMALSLVVLHWGDDEGPRFAGTTTA